MVRAVRKGLAFVRDEGVVIVAIGFPVTLVAFIVWAIVATGNPTWGVNTHASLGPGCPQTRDRGTRTTVRPGGDGWHTATGGDPGDGCNGAILYTQVSGTQPNGTRDQWKDDFDWRLSPGIKNDGAYCNFLVHIPDSPRAAGRATYLVFRRRGAGQTSEGGFTVDQSKHRGHWFKSHVIIIRHDVSTVELVLTDLGAGHYTVAADAATTNCVSFALSD